MRSMVASLPPGTRIAGLVLALHGDCLPGLPLPEQPGNDALALGLLPHRGKDLWNLIRTQSLP